MVGFAQETSLLIASKVMKASILTKSFTGHFISWHFHLSTLFLVERHTSSLLELRSAQDVAMWMMWISDVESSIVVTNSPGWGDTSSSSSFTESDKEGRHGNWLVVLSNIPPFAPITSAWQFSRPSTALFGTSRKQMVAGATWRWTSWLPKGKKPSSQTDDIQERK